MKSYIAKILLVALITLGYSTSLFAQGVVEPRKSPMALAKYTSSDLYIFIVYSQPHKRDRVIFGNLVPFDTIWRFGANETTQLTTTKDLTIGDKTLKAGTYSLYALPGENEWTLIFNNKLGTWGSYGYEESADILKVSVKPEGTEESWEAFTISFVENDDELKMVAMWDNTSISLPISH